MKWYEKTWVIILFLIFFFPVGLYLMWKYSKWNKAVKVVLTIFFALVIIGNIGKNNTVTTKQDSKEIEQAEKKDDLVKEETVKKETVKEEKKSNKIKSGTYKIGSDIPAGEYLVISKSAAYIQCASDSTGTLESIIFNDNLASKGCTSYVTLNDGEYFKLTGGEMYPVAEAPSLIPSDGIYQEGMYKVGQDIPAGEYKVILNENSSTGMGYIEVSTNSRHTLNDIVTNDNIEADTYITVSDGQYLKLQNVHIQK
ncbi:hypothetical protein [Clostridium sp. M14]|uniref:hypothetical protein n=1 Tax=Clostridium sp. M14 TaxID=2716311 RepID=UPI0013EED2C0|nr:hypothetical protein [Clostridium sp. M14]MBZ9691651.1 hypothetical protein [Clostridium sp. M14]NFI56602.1 hypothetical protein [Clostridium botulinum]